MGDDPLRAQLVRMLDWEEAHIGFDKAVDGLPSDKRGALAPRVEHSVWQLVEQLRIAQEDIFDFNVNPKYVHSMKWPEDYWPKASEPPNAAAWDLDATSNRYGRRRRAPSADPNLPSIFTAVQEQLGVKLESTKAPVDVLVLDHVERPTPD